jgi:hypothetical protein
MLCSGRLHPDTGGEYVRHNMLTLKNEILPATYEAAGMISKDIILFTAADKYGGPASCRKNYFEGQGFKDIVGEFPRGSWYEKGKTVYNFFDILKASCRFWWDGYREDGTSVGYNMPDYLERVVAQLYPYERDRVCQVRLSSYYGTRFKTIRLKDFYNFPLRRFKYRKDDFDFTFLSDCDFLPNTVPFSILEGVDDLYDDSALIVAGNGWNVGVFSVPAGIVAKSLVFLHTLILERDFTQVGEGTEKEDNIAGHYIIHYADGTEEIAVIEYNRTICHYKAGTKQNTGAISANPAIVGVTEFGFAYAIYSQEWINPKPELEIRSIDMIPQGLRKEEGIILFGITAVL